MRNRTLGLVASLALAMLITPAFGQVNAFITGGRMVASAFGQWNARTTNAITSGSQTITVDRCTVVAGNGIGVNFVPWAVNVPITIVDSNSETVTPTAVVTPSAGSTTGCSVTATFSNSHGAGATITSGDGGLGEAIVYAGSNGGVIALDPSWGGTTAQITGTPIGALGNTKDIIEDIRGGGVVTYGYNTAGSKFVMLYQASAAGGHFGSSNPDFLGTKTLSGGAGTVTFVNAYTAAPVCTCTDQTTAAAVKCSTSTTALTIAGTTTDVIAYACYGNPN